MNETIKLIIAVAVGAILLLGYNYMAEVFNKAALADERGQVIQTTGNAQVHSAVADTARSEVDDSIDQGRGSYGTTVEVIYQRDPEARARGAQRVPDDQLRAFRERRLARERSVRNADRDGARAETEEASER